MVINACLAIVRWLLGLLLTGLQIVALPAKFGSVVLTIISKLAEGFAILNVYVDSVYIGALFAVCVSVMALFNAWRLVRWIIRKIPFFGID